MVAEILANDLYRKLIFSVFFWFGIGFGLPLLALSLISGALQKTITRWLARHARLINIIGGVLLIAIALFDIWANWAMIRLVLGL